jgi:hypothetical protein
MEVLYRAVDDSDIRIAPADDSEVYNRPLPGSMPFERAAHFPAVPVTME